MERPPSERPSAVTVIGVFSIVLAAFFILGALAGFARVAGVQLMPSGKVPAGTEEVAALASRGAAPMAILQLTIAGVILWGSIQLLHLQESGRRMLEALNWFGVAYVVGTSMYGMWLSSAVAAAMPDVGGGAPAAFTGLAIIIGTLIWAAVQLVVITLIIWELRTPAVREAMRA